MPTQCFWLEPTEMQAIYLRRFVWSGEGSSCDASGMGSHDAMTRIEDQPTRLDENGKHDSIDAKEFFGDPRWPAECACGYVFTDSDVWQVFQNTLYTRSDTGERIPLREAPPGAMWDATWLAEYWHGDDGRCLMVKLPNGHEWCVDSQCSNCTMPDDREQRQHHCWIRHGSPEKPETVTVDKRGVTCKAGAGSIQSGNYHGHLRNGVLTDS